MSSAVYLWKTFRAQAEQHSVVSQKVFGFSPESVFAFVTGTIKWPRLPRYGSILAVNLPIVLQNWKQYL